MLLCVRWYLSYGLSLRDLEEMIAERGMSVDHATIHRWLVNHAPKMQEKFNALAAKAHNVKEQNAHHHKLYDRTRFSTQNFACPIRRGFI